MKIERNGSHHGGVRSPDHFTGKVSFELLIKAPDPARVTAANVTFEPAARTAWHTHPLGQTLIITAGRGLVQRWGGPIEEVRPGDVVWFSPDEKHWHGAAADSSMTHVAIQEWIDGRNADWLELVSDAQYGGKAE